MARLASAQLGAGDTGSARASARAALDLTRRRHTRFHEIPARIELARAIVATDGAACASEVEQHLERALSLVAGVGAFAFTPQVHRAYSELALSEDDAPRAERHAAEGRRVLEAMREDAQPSLLRQADR